MPRFHKVIALSILLVFVTLPQQVSALELSITENGEGSSSVVEVASSSETNVVQTGNADVVNNVQATADTGNNTISNSTTPSGENTIETGDSKTVVNVVTEVNSNQVNTSNCCDNKEGSSVVVANNGSNSNNAVTVAAVSNVSVVSNQTGNISTNISAKSNTGNNSIKESSGNNSIKTGNAKTVVSSTTVVNSAFVNVSQQTPLALAIVIKNNGSDSNQKVAVSFINNRSIEILNSANIENKITATSNTGDNTISNGLGGASISTGEATTIITSTNIANMSKVVVNDCCSKENDPDDPGNPVVPPIGGGGNISTASSSSSGGVGGGGSVLAASTGDVLPATGMNITLWATIFNVFMLIMGLYLRKKAARSPANA